MKTLQIGGGIVLIAFAILLAFGIIVSSLKEGDENVFIYLSVPLLILTMGIYLVKGRKLKSN
jgi:sulfite exporter TauE/SafE